MAKALRRWASGQDSKVEQGSGLPQRAGLSKRGTGEAQKTHHTCIKPVSTALQNRATVMHTARKSEEVGSTTWGSACRSSETHCTCPGREIEALGLAKYLTV